MGRGRRERWSGGRGESEADVCAKRTSRRFDSRRENPQENDRFKNNEPSCVIWDIEVNVIELYRPGI